MPETRPCPKPYPDPSSNLDLDFWRWPWPWPYPSRTLTLALPLTWQLLAWGSEKPRLVAPTQQVHRIRQHSAQWLHPPWVQLVCCAD